MFHRSAPIGAEDAPEIDTGPDDEELEDGLRAAAKAGFDHDVPFADGLATCPSCGTVFHAGDAPLAGARELHDAMGHDDLRVVSLSCPGCGLHGRLVASTLDLRPSEAFTMR